MEGRILIVGGAAAVGKMTLCADLVRMIAARPRIPSFFCFRQPFTYHPLNPDHPESHPTAKTVQTHLARLLDQVRVLAEHPGYMLLESFHWTLALRPGGIGNTAWFSEFEAELTALGTKSVLVAADRNRHREQLLQRRGTEFFSTYGQRYGRTEDEVIEYYIGEQNAFEAMAAKSPIDTLVLDTRSNEAVTRVSNFWIS